MKKYRGSIARMLRAGTIKESDLKKIKVIKAPTKAVSPEKQRPNTCYVLLTEKSDHESSGTTTWFGFPDRAAAQRWLKGGAEALFNWKSEQDRFIGSGGSTEWEIIAPSNAKDPLKWLAKEKQYLVDNHAEGCAICEKDALDKDGLPIRDWSWNPNRQGVAHPKCAAKEKKAAKEAQA